MATILLLSGPNLNLLGQREPEHYGSTTLDEVVALARETAAKLGHDVEHVQSNHEGDLIDAIHGASGRCAANVINAGAFTHYS
jgi:3-dehydroquinate dehydratase-2